MQPVTLYHADALDLLNPERGAINPESVACIHFDGSYGMGYQSHRREEFLDKMNGDNDVPAMMSLHMYAFDLSEHILVPGGSLFMWTSLTRKSAIEVLSPILVEFQWRDEKHSPKWATLCNKIIWDKIVFGTGWNWRRAYEEVFHFFKGKELRWCGGNGMSNVIREPRPVIPTDGHSAMKPLAVVSHLLKAVTKPGDLVVDPVMGSGSAIEAAWRMGCRVIGGDNDMKWVAYTADRLKRLGAQVDIRTMESHDK